MIFRLAKMCSVIRTLTVILLVLPVGLVIGALAGPRPLLLPAGLVILIYAWVWARFRATRFVVHSDKIEVIWPLKRRELRRSDISEVRLVTRKKLEQQAGRGMRVGAGGLWGGFGWLWTTRRGIVQMYISRLDGLVWIERGTLRPWLITPDQPEDFVRVLSALSPQHQ